MEVYRFVDHSEGVTSLLPSPAPKTYGGDAGLPGCIYNIDGIRDIAKVEVTFRHCFVSRPGTSPDNTPYLELGEGREASLREFIPLGAQEKVTWAFLLPGLGYNYFRLACGDYKIDIDSFAISYLGGAEVRPAYDDPWAGLTRRNPVVNQKPLTEGLTLNVPFRGQQKELTYYSYDYIVGHPDLAKKAALTDPAEVAAYFNAFSTYPVNYVSKGEYSSALPLFGKDTRCWSFYVRVDGYATSLPVVSAAAGYYELDVDLDGSYSGSSRGVGRVVCWNAGFTGPGYDASPVSVYTDDHYFTFQEYGNDGYWSKRFNAEGHPTAYSRV